jgi:hypothetical protein
MGRLIREWRSDGSIHALTSYQKRAMLMAVQSKYQHPTITIYDACAGEPIAVGDGDLGKRVTCAVLQSVTTPAVDWSYDR